MDTDQGSARATPVAGRFYKSRKSRPCDCCRKRKVACDMPTGPPCQRCTARTLSCTFTQGPGVRKRKGLPPADGITLPTEAWDYDPLTFPFQDFFGLSEHTFSADEIPSLQFPGAILPETEPGEVARNVSSQGSSGGNDFLHCSPRSSTQASIVSEPRLGTGSRSPPETEPESRMSFQSAHQSLEVIPGAFSFYVGPTGAADVHLLSRESYDSHDLYRSRLSGLQYRRLDQQSSTIFGITDLKLLENAEPRVNTSEIEAAWAELWSIVDTKTAWRLIQLYGRFIDPYFPILAHQQLPTGPEELSNMSLGLLAAICASALPFIMYDESLYSLLLHPPSSQQLYRLCWLDISQQFHSPSLATLQACLLLLQKLPTNAYLSDTAFSWALISSAIAVAQTVGLHRDPTPWDSVPIWERKLRKRLWWSLWAMEQWIALTRGMPSHVHEDDFDVPELTPDDISNTISSSTHTKTHLYQLVRMTRIMADIQQTYFTTRAINRTSQDLQLSLELARSARARLKQWRDGLPQNYQFSNAAKSQSDASDIDGSGSVYLAYIITHMTLFRALLRPLDRWTDATATSSTEFESQYASIKAVITGSILCVKDFVEMLETLTGPQWNAFWHSWSRPNFAIGGSFMVHLLHIISAVKMVGNNTHSSMSNRELSFEDDDKELRAWIRRWRSAIRVSATGAAGAKGLANLGLVRVETMLARVLSTGEVNET